MAIANQIQMEIMHECNHVKHMIHSHAFTTYIQPIFSLTNGSIHGYEVLNRPNGVQADVFYEDIVKCGCSQKVDQFLIQHSLKLANSLPGTTFINAFPSTLLFIQVVDELKKKVVFEISEHHTLEEFYGLSSAIQEKSFTVAIDDMGKGASGLRALVEINPAYIKLDRWLISDIDSSDLKRDMVQMLVEYADGKSQVIAEGIERPEELETLKALHVKFGQGFFLQRPVIPEIDKLKKRLINNV